MSQNNWFICVSYCVQVFLQIALSQIGSMEVNLVYVVYLRSPQPLAIKYNKTH